MAAVDAHVAAWLVTHAINGPLMHNKTRIICSNSPLLTLVADQSIRLYRGKIISNEVPGGSVEKAVRGGSTRGVHGHEATPLSIALGLAGLPLVPCLTWPSQCTAASA